MDENKDKKAEELEEELTPQEEQREQEQEQEQEQESASAEENEEEGKQDAADAPAEEEERDPLEVAKEKIAELNDKYIRKVAEFDNYRKRTLKEKTELILNGGEKTITKILPIIDDMERAIANGEKTDDVATLREGMDLIYKKFLKILEGEGVELIATVGEDFNTDYHEAIAMVPGMGDDKKGKVIDCVQTGYTLNGKVIRYAKVAVGQ
ncbi:MAG: nucleotide exchange factor GrpE [Prevotella sp.]|nr:nucleotide exchange factor GrpE [Prevotella sp.]